MRPARRLPLLLALLALAALAPAGVADPAPGDHTLFSVDLSPRGPLPDPTVVRYNATLPLQLNVSGPAGLVPPDEVDLSGRDGRGTPLSFSPNPVPLEHGRHTYPVDAAYRPPALGPAHLAAEADGPARATDRWTRNLSVIRDPVEVTIADVGDAGATWSVPLRVEANTTALPREEANLTPVVRWAGDDPTPGWNATTRTANLTRSPATWPLPFDARFGAGRYQVRVHVDSPRAQGISSPVLVDVEEPDHADDDANVTARVPDEPTRLTLARDPVNDDGKAKYPGQAVITRVVARDPNGIEAEEAHVQVRRLRPDGSEVPVRNATHPLPADAWARRSVSLEDRFAWAPLKDGRYTVTVSLPGTDADPVRRTFRIRDEQATLARGALPDATAATPVPPLEGHALVADDNLGGGPDGPPVSEFGVLSARTYRYTQELAPPAGVTFPDGNATLDLSGARSRPSTYDYTTHGDAGRFRVPFQVGLPEDPEPGRYHVTLEHADGGTRRDLGSIYFDLEAPPAVTTLEPVPAPPGSNLTVDAAVDGANETAAVEVVLRGPPEDGQRPTLSRRNVTGFPAEITLPEGPDPEASIQVEATPLLPDGRRGDAETATVPVEAQPPAVRAAVAVDGTPAPHAPLRLVPRTAHSLDLAVGLAGVHGERPDAQARLLDWNGAPVEEADCPRADAPAGASCSLHLPANLTAGRYTLQVQATGPGGTTTWNRSLEAGPWLDLAVQDPLELAPAGDGTLAGTTAVANRGNVPVGELEVLLQPLDGPEGTTWRPGNVTLTTPADGVEPRTQAGATVLAGVDGPALPPGDRLTVEVEVPVEPGVPAGRYEGELTVATTLEGIP